MKLNINLFTLYVNVFLFVFSLNSISYSKTQIIDNNKILFWDKTNRGCNYFNQEPKEEWFKEASLNNIKWVRLAYDKWKSEGKDFLIGNVSNYQGLVKKDLKILKKVLSWAEKYKLKIVIIPLSLPGSRWKQNNNNLIDSRLWNNFLYHEKSIKYWQDLARELKKYPCIVAYDIINEPFPEFKTNIQEQTTIGNYERFQNWYYKYNNTTKDLFLFYNKIINSIREVDINTPIMIESGFYSQPSSYYEFPKKFQDNKILYSFHMYEPYSFTSFENFKNSNNYIYPGNIFFGESKIFWNKKTIDDYFNPFYKWINNNSINSNRVVVSEFGCMRKNKGCKEYLNDIIDILESKKFHWAFYSFREDEWDGYDYELGTQKIPYKIVNTNKIKFFRKDNELFNVIKKGLNN